MSHTPAKDLLKFWASFEILVCQIERAECHRLLETHLNWLDVGRIEHTTGHMIETVMLYDKWQVTHCWMCHITEARKLPGYKSLEHHVRQVMNPVTMARWNGGYHADLSWAIVLPNGSRLGGDLEIEHETKEISDEIQDR